MLKNNGIKSVPTTIKNSTANSIIERMHQTMTNQLRSIFLSRETPQNFEQAARIVEDALAATVFSFSCYNAFYFKDISFCTTSIP